MAWEPSAWWRKGQLPLTDPAAAGAAGPAAATRMSDDTVTDLLERLSSGRVDAAWIEFLARYSPLIKHVIRRHGLDDDRITECFNHVCGALSDHGFRRLLSFRPDGPARFKTWLMAVVSNLCVDWRRKEQGRVRPPQCVSRLPELDQQVYRCIFVHRMSRAHCLEALTPRFPELTEATVAEINARLFALLTPQQRWQMSLRTSVPKPVASSAGLQDDDPAWQLATSEPGPDDLAAELQEQRQLQDALSKLPAEQRLLLRLRYEQALSLAEVARLTGQPDPFRANRQIQAALDTLADRMGGHRVRPERKTR
jgi:RNA polymerase sigma factor (sigma-70 family)